jgi:hypothetical protein
MQVYFEVVHILSIVFDWSGFSELFSEIFLNIQSWILDVLLLIGAVDYMWPSESPCTKYCIKPAIEKLLEAKSPQ